MELSEEPNECNIKAIARIIVEDTAQNKDSEYINNMSMLERYGLQNKESFNTENLTKISLRERDENYMDGAHLNVKQQCLFNKNTSFPENVTPDINHYSVLEKLFSKEQPSDTINRCKEVVGVTSSDESIVNKENIVEGAPVPRIISETKASDAFIPHEIISPSSPLTPLTMKRSLSLSDMKAKEEAKNSVKEVSSKTPAVPITDTLRPVTKEGLTDDKRSLIKSSKYMLIRTIGRGNFAKVKLAKHLATDRIVAIKIIDKTKLEKQVLSKITREVSLMKELNHPNIVQLLEVMENASTLYMVMEYASGGELFDYLVSHGCMREKDARIKFREMLSAVQYCHSKNIVHRDLKAENMLLSSKLEIKIADFGFANKFNANSTLNTFCGSPPYAAPELFQGKKYVGPEVDVWSLGVILFTLVSGRLPFDASNFSDLRHKVINLRYEFPYFISNQCESLLRKMLTVSTKIRATIDKIMCDPWVNGGGLPMMTVFTDKEVFICKERVEMLKEMGFHESDIEETFREKKFNAINATYSLLRPATSHDSVSSIPVPPHSLTVTSMDRNNVKPKNECIEVPQSSAKKESHSLTMTTANALGKTFKNWLLRKSDISDTEDHRFPLKTSRTNSKDLQKQYHNTMTLMNKEMLNDATSSIPKGANQQAILATLNQLSISKHQKAGMFQANTITAGSPNSRQSDKSNTMNVPRISLVPTKSNEVVKMGKFTVENVSLPQSASQNKKGYVSGNVDATSHHHYHSSKNQIEQEEAAEYHSEQTHKKTDEVTIKSDASSAKELKKRRRSTIRNDDTLTKIGEITELAWTKFDPKTKPRFANFAFSLNTTSSKNPDDIVLEIVRVLKANNYRFEFLEKYLLLCWLGRKEDEVVDTSIQWEMEVCRIPVLFMAGVRMKRIFGSSFAYKMVASKITHSFKL